MKVVTVLGTRPEIIRLSRIIPLLDRYCTHILVHTGQNFDSNLSEIFFQDLCVRKPDYYLGIQADSIGDQIGKILSGCETIFRSENPDKILILGDTNSALCAIIAKRMGIPVYHMEAGNRCFDDRVPEELNRKVIDHSSDILLPYTERSRMNLLREGIPSNRIIVTGNPILEVINYYQDYIGKSKILDKLAISKGKYFLVSIHRAENVDIESRLRCLITSIVSLKTQYDIPVICSLHPRTKDKIQHFNIEVDPLLIQLCEPFGFFDFIRLEQDAFCVLSDSGTVQEECCILHIPNVTLRDVTERPETVECGSNVLSGVDEEMIMNCVQAVVSQASKWSAPPEYLNDHVSMIIMKIILGLHIGN